MATVAEYASVVDNVAASCDAAPPSVMLPSHASRNCSSTEARTSGDWIDGVVTSPLRAAEIAVVVVDQLNTSTAAATGAPPFEAVTPRNAVPVAPANVGRLIGAV